MPQQARKKRSEQNEWAEEWAIHQSFRTLRGNVEDYLEAGAGNEQRTTPISTVASCGKT